MEPKIRLAAIALIVFLALYPAHPANGTVQIDIVGSTVSVQISSTVTQNITSIPVFSAYYGPDNSSIISESVQDALRASSSQARVEELSLNVSSTNGSNSTIAFNLMFKVSQVVELRGELVDIDLSWKSFAVTSDILFQDHSVNLVGEAYMLPVILDFMTAPPTPGLSFRAFIDGTGPRNIPDMTKATKAIAFLNMSTFSNPISEMGLSYFLSENRTSFSSGPRNVRLRFIESESNPPFEPITVYYVITFDNQLDVSVQGRATASGDRLLLETGSSAAAIMTFAIVALTGVLVGTGLYERRLTSASRRGPRRTRT